MQENIIFIMLLIAICSIIAFIFLYIKINLSLSTVLVTSIAIIHGLAYIYYTRTWVYGSGYLYDYYNLHVRSKSPSASTIDHIFNLQANHNFHSALNNLDAAMISLYFGIIIGILLADHLIQLPHKSQTHKYISPSSTQARPHALIHAAYIVALLFMAYTAINNNHIGRTTEYFSSTGNELLKIQMRHTLIADGYFYRLFVSTAALFMSAYAIAHLSKQGPLSVTVTVFFIATVFFAKLALLSKAPATIFLAQMMLAFALSRHKGFNHKFTLLGPMIVATLLSFVTLIAIPSLDSIGALASFLFYRILMIPNEILLEYFLTFPNYVDHTWGLDNKFLAFFLHTPPKELPYNIVAHHMHGSNATTSNGMFIADAWAEFSWLGVLATPIIAGMVIRSLDRWLSLLAANPSLQIAGLTMGHWGIFVMLSTSFQTSLLTGGLALIVPLAFIISWLSGTPINATNRSN